MHFHRLSSMYLDRYLGVTLVLLALINGVVNGVESDFWYEMFWYCNVAMITLGFGFFMKSKLLVSTVYLTAIPAQSFWGIDYLLTLFDVGLGRTDVLMQEATELQFYLSTLFHMTLIPLAVFGVCRFGYDTSAYKKVILWYCLVMHMATLIFTPIPLNINCAFFPCDSRLSDPIPTYILAHPEALSLYFLGNILFWSFLAIVHHAVTVRVCRFRVF